MVQVAGMALRRGGSAGNHGSTAADSDDVQRSIELLDRVLSEFDESDNGALPSQNVPQQMTSSASTPQLRQNSSSNTSNSAVNHVSGARKGKARATAPVPLVAPSSPDDESPSLGHQSEDDGYMSMNGRKAKFNLAFIPLAEVSSTGNHLENGDANHDNVRILNDPDDFPPPPEEAQRLIAKLLPTLSPTSRPRCGIWMRTTHEAIPPPQRFQNTSTAVVTPSMPNGLPDEPITHMATQTTLPKTRHQRPYGWEHNNDFTIYPPPLPPPGCRFGGLPFQHPSYPLISPNRVPPRTVASAGIERHREVKRCIGELATSDSEDFEDRLRPLSELADDQEEHFSDDSLEDSTGDLLPMTNDTEALRPKRTSIAWEVPLDDGPTTTTRSSESKARRPRKLHQTLTMGSSSTAADTWPDPPYFNDSSHENDGDEDGDDRDDNSEVTPPTTASPVSDTDLEPPLHSSHSDDSILRGTYIVRRHHNHRKSILPTTDGIGTPSSDTPSPPRLSLDLDRPSKQSHSTTYDNIQSLMTGNAGCGGLGSMTNGQHSANNTPSDSNDPSITRVISLPTLNNTSKQRELDVTVEEDEDDDDDDDDNDVVVVEDEDDDDEEQMSPLRKIEQNISEILERRDPWKPRSGIQKSESAKEMLIHRPPPMQPAPPGTLADLLFPPLPPSPVAEFAGDDEDDLNGRHPLTGYHQNLGTRAGTLPEKPAIPSHGLRHNAGLLKTHSMDGHYGASRNSGSGMGRRSQIYQSASGPGTRKYHKRSGQMLLGSSGRSTAHNSSGSSLEKKGSNGTTPEKIIRDNSVDQHSTPSSAIYLRSKKPQSHMQTSCSLPETPIFGRGCDISARPTPHRRAPDIPPPTPPTNTMSSISSTGNGLSLSGTGARQSSTMGSLNTILSTSASTGATGSASYQRRGLMTTSSSSGLEQAMVGAELLRMAGGPSRGWYPKRRSRRPLSTEHLDRLATVSGHHPWDMMVHSASQSHGTGSMGGMGRHPMGRKPLTLPPNLTPKFFQRSPRDALRRVTSLLIRKGNSNGGSGKDSRKDKELVSPTIHEHANDGDEEIANGQVGQTKKKGFFKNLWKRSRHYSLEQH